MSVITANGIRLYYETTGTGVPILCIHGSAGSAMSFRSSVQALAALGRVIVYDRRGCSRSERPEPFATSVAQQVDDAAGLLLALDAVPAIVLGHSYGAGIAVGLALSRPELVRALVLLEPPVRGLDRGFDGLNGRLRPRLEALARTDPAAVARAFMARALGPATWDAMRPEARQALTDNGPALLAESRGKGVTAKPSQLATLSMPVLVVAGTESPPEFRRVAKLVADAIPNAQLAVVAGGHMIRPANPDVVQFIGAITHAGPPDRAA